MNIQEIVAPQDQEQLQELLNAMNVGEVPDSMEIQRVTKAGKVIDVWLTFTRLVDDSGNPFVVATTERDTSTLKNNNRENDEKS